MNRLFNKVNGTILKSKLLLLFSLVCWYPNKGYSQEIKLEKGREYILGGVKVTGKVNFNQQTVVTYSGLQKGQKIIVPGEQIGHAIKKLWKLGLFSDVNFYAAEIRADSIFLELELNELPKLNDVKILGLKKGKIEELVDELNLNKGKVVNENLLTTTTNYIKNKYKKEGFYHTKVAINTKSDTLDSTSANVNMLIRVDKGERVKVQSIDFEGNELISDRDLRRFMKNTKKQNALRVYKRSKYVQGDYQEDLKRIIDKYKERGFRDARVSSDLVSVDTLTDKLKINIGIQEGKKYYFGDIRFLGNSAYSDNQLRRILGISKGDVYNGVLLQKRIQDNTKPDANDIANLYQNNGYLFSNINAVEVKTQNDTIDFEIRIVEGPVAYFNRITVKGNHTTNDHVIYREIRTKPGQKYSKEQLIRTIRELSQLRLFDPEAIDPKFKNVDAQNGTVDIEYNLEEKGSSQVELQGGYGGGGLIITLGLSFNNFSIRNLFNKEAYKPLPRGDGQSLALRVQRSTYFQVYSLSFSEPWLGGKKPINFSSSLSHSRQFLFDFGNRDVSRDKNFDITTLAFGVSKRLKVPDDYFFASANVSFQYYDLNNYETRLFTFGDGSSRNLAFTLGLRRDSRGFNPIYPMYGSLFSVSSKFTFPYSLVNGVDYADLPNQEAYKLKNEGQGYFNANNQWVPPGAYIDSQGNATFDYTQAVANQSKVDQMKFNWLEFYKVKFKAEWYTKLVDKLVLRNVGEFGFLGAYNYDRGLVPFERFFVGGDGLANFSLDGRETVQLRGYPNNSLSTQDGDVIYNKYSMEIRYPITLKGATTIYGLSFLEAGAAYQGFKAYNPFDIKRSAGVGLRVWMPQFGLLGIDFAHGFDTVPGTNTLGGWQTHFIFGQQF